MMVASAAARERADRFPDDGAALALELGENPCLQSSRPAARVDDEGPSLAKNDQLDLVGMRLLSAPCRDHLVSYGREGQTETSAMPHAVSARASLVRKAVEEVARGKADGRWSLAAAGRSIGSPRVDGLAVPGARGSGNLHGIGAGGVVADVELDEPGVGHRQSINALAGAERRQAS